MARFTESNSNLIVPTSIKDSNGNDFISFSRTGTGTARIETPQDDLSLRSARDITIYAGQDGPGNVYIGWGDAVYTPDSTNKVATLADLGVIPQIDHIYTDNNEHYPAESWAGKHIYFTYDSNWDAIFLPEDSSLNLPIGYTFTIITDNHSGGYIYINANDSNVTEVTAVGVDYSSIGYDIPGNTMVTVMKIGSNRWIISGYGITQD
jgi:hypothetical protein